MTESVLIDRHEWLQERKKELANSGETSDVPYVDKLIDETLRLLSDLNEING
jgi:hypothetical protein